VEGLEWNVAGCLALFRGFFFLSVQLFLKNIQNCEYGENLFFEIILDGLKNLKQNYKKLDKI
jgi:hypothetical protein